MNRVELVRHIKDKAFSFVAHIYLISAFFSFWFTVNQYRHGKADEISWVSYALLSPIALAAGLAILFYAAQFALQAVTILGIADIPPLQRLV